MTPIVAHDLEGQTLLILAFLPGPTQDDYATAVCVGEGGTMYEYEIDKLVIWRPTPDFPLGYRFHAAPEGEK